MPDVDLTDVMEHLSIAFAGIYEKLGERDTGLYTLAKRVDALRSDVDALANRIEGMHRSLSERIEHATDVAAGRDAR